MLGPLLFNIFLNDLFYFIHRANLSDHADDNQIYFSKHIAKITKKVGNQLDVLSRLKNTLSISSKMCLSNSYVMSCFTYCSAIWNNCNKSDKQKLERLNVRT